MIADDERFKAAVRAETRGSPPELIAAIGGIEMDMEMILEVLIQLLTVLGPLLGGGGGGSMGS